MNVTPLVLVAILKSLPLVPVAKVNVVVASPLIEVTEPPDIPSVEVATHDEVVPLVWRTYPLIGDVPICGDEIGATAYTVAIPSIDNNAISFFIVSIDS